MCIYSTVFLGGMYVFNIVQKFKLFKKKLNCKLFFNGKILKSYIFQILKCRYFWEQFIIITLLYSTEYNIFDLSPPHRTFLREVLTHKCSQATSLSLIPVYSSTFRFLYLLPVFFPFFPGLDIFVVEHSTWAGNRHGSRFTHARTLWRNSHTWLCLRTWCFINRYWFLFFSPLFSCFSLGTSPPFLLFHLSKNGKLARRGDVEKLNFQWESPLFSLFHPLSLCLSLSFPLSVSSL